MGGRLTGDPQGARPSKKSCVRVLFAGTLATAILVAAVAEPAAAQTTNAKPRATAVHAKKSTPTRAARKTTTKGTAATRKPRASVSPVDVGNPREAQAEQSAERDRLTARIAELKQQIAAGERSRSGATQALQKAERALTSVNRQLAELTRRQREGQERVAGLDRQRSGTASQIDAQQAAFGRTATMLYANRQRDPTEIYAGGGDPGETMMTDVYLRYVARAQTDTIAALEGRARDLQSQRQRADDENRQLLAETEEQRSARDTLAADRTAQKKSLDELTQQLAQQRSTAASLAANEQRLTRVVEQLQRVIDRQAAEERARREAERRETERREAARREAESRAASKADAKAGRKKSPLSPPSEAPPPTPVETTPEPSSGSGAFAQLRGQLRLPVRGAIVGRFGTPRGTSGATWKGVFVRTDAGADVRAVAAGKVVFADNLRGFGNLVIIDHGDQYLSIYGNNQTLQKHAGDTVRQGDVIARAGDSSGDDETGLYFELRYRGRPFDPLTWTGSR